MSSVRKIIYEIMKRNDFFKTLGIGIAGIAITPTILKAEEVLPTTKDVKVAIDIKSISGFINGGKQVGPLKILQIYRETGILIYKSSEYCKPPIVLQGEIKVIEIK
jgi:hypothetical protein